jgi:hypothetical protein
VREERLKKSSRAWQQAVLGLGAFNAWIGVVRDISAAYDPPRITVEIAGGLRVWAQVQLSSPVFEAVRGMRSYPPTPVVLSGRIVANELSITAHSDDDLFPTCFEDALGLTGCEINLASIRAIP